MTRSRLRIVLAVTVVAAVAGYASTSFQPTLYASHSVLAMVPQRVPEHFVQSGRSITDLDQRVRTATASILSRTRLERLVDDLELYPDDQKSGVPIATIVREMRDDIVVTSLGDGTFRVQFSYVDPKLAHRVTERLASLFVEENLRDREMIAENTNQFLDSQLDEIRRRLNLKDAELEAMRREGRRVAESDRLELEVFQSTYRSLLTKSLDAKVAANMERRQIGEQFRITDAARVPEQPLDRGGMKTGLVSGLAGLVLGLAFMVVGPKPKA